MRKLVFFSFFIFTTSSVVAQFGKNKVQYKDFEWMYIQTNHFDIYFSEEGRDIAEFTANVAEEALENIMSDLNYEINNRISLIVYNSHNDFTETNTTQGYLSQGIGGFTEPFKNRVVFPFEGDYQKFWHVISHELVHAVMRDMLYGGTVQNIIAKNITLQLPLWYHEGMAEFLTSGWETNSDMFIRDAIINTYLPDIQGLYGYFAYRGGQALFYYISKTYGRKKIGELLNKTKGLGSLEAGLKSSIGLTIEELNNRWKKWIKKEYWPEIALRQDPDEFAKRLTDNKESGGFYNTSPAISPQGDKIAFISDRDIFLDIFVMNALDGEIVTKIDGFGRQNDLEELNLLFPSVSWAPDNNRLAVSKKGQGYDIVAIVDVAEDESYELPFELQGIETTAWSPDGRYIAFNAHNARQSDIYVFDLETEELINLTNDIFSDFTPVWSPDGSLLVFSSDRDKYIGEDRFKFDGYNMISHDYSKRDIYSVTFPEGKISRITDWEYSSQKSAVISEDGKSILFVSDKNGIDNIYKKRIEIEPADTVDSIVDLPAVPITNSLNGINQLSISEDRKKLAFTSLFNSGYNIFTINNPFEIELESDTLQLTPFMERVASGEEFSDDTFNLPDSVQSTDNVLNHFISASDSQESETDTSNSRRKIYTGKYVGDKDTTRTADYSNYIFSPNRKVESDTTALTKNIFNQKLDDDGNFLVNEYKINFTPDLVYANAYVSTYYGLLGTTVLSFSDMLGNHQLVGMTGLQVDLKNSDYGLAYYYLPKRINYGVELFHTARFVYLAGLNRTELYRYRNFGAAFSASLPLDTYNRFDLSLSVMRVTSENLDNQLVPMDNATFIIPQLSYVYDDVLFGYTSPIQGSRYKFTLFGNTGIGSSEPNSFYSLIFDVRKYFRFFYDNSFVFRLSGGYSGGAAPQRFFLGGVDNWINRSFASGTIPLESPADFAFLTPALPMRGYNYSEKIGTKYSLLNMEFRLPLIRYLLTGPLPLLFQNVIGTAFLDAGAAWYDNSKLQLFGRNENGNVVTKDLLMGMGFGARIYFLFLWRFDWAWSYDLNKFSKPKFYISLGYDF
ncbi:MAG: PD40 domain-containing protein [Melioribacteraceae bacterium]|nr:PD40 domain-containing protein [Melioribacteraceae bacterium]